MAKKKTKKVRKKHPKRLSVYLTEETAAHFERLKEIADDSNLNVNYCLNLAIKMLSTLLHHYDSAVMTQFGYIAVLMSHALYVFEKSEGRQPSKKLLEDIRKRAKSLTTDEPWTTVTRERIKKHYRTVLDISLDKAAKLAHNVASGVILNQEEFDGDFRSALDKFFKPLQEALAAEDAEPFGVKLGLSGGQKEQLRAIQKELGLPVGGKRPGIKDVIKT